MGGARHSEGDVVGTWRLAVYVTAGCWRASCTTCGYEPSACSVSALRARRCVGCNPRGSTKRELVVPTSERVAVAVGDRVGEWECVSARSGTRDPRWRCVVCSHVRGVNRAIAASSGCARCHGVIGHRAIPRHVEREAQDLPDLTRWIAEDSPEAWAWIEATIDVCGPMSQEEIALCIGVTRQRVDQIQAGALRKLAAACARYGLSAEDAIGSLRGESTLPDHNVPGAYHTHTRSYHAAERAARAEAPPDCEPGEPMAVACLAELERIEARMRAVHAVLDCAAELDTPLAAE